MQTNIISTIGWAIFTTLIVLSLSGCGGGGGDVPSIGDDPLTITGASGNQVALDGSWSAGCKLNDEGNMEESVLTISGSSYSNTIKLWEGAVDCSGSPFLIGEIIGTFTLGEEVTATLNGSPVTATKTDVAVTTAFATIIDANLIPSANIEQWCDVTGWVLNTAKDVNVVGSDCIPTPKDITYINDKVDPDLKYAGLEVKKGGTLDPNGYPTVVDAGSAAARLSYYTVSGTVTLPASVINREWYVTIDNDHDGSNGEIANVFGVVTGSAFNYSLGNVPSGDYFIYGEVDMTGTLGPWSTGDYVGVGCGTIDSPCKVTIDSPKTVDFTLVENTDTDMVLLLDGVDDKAEATTSIFPNITTPQSFTVEAWIYPTPTTATVSFIATDDAYNLILFYDPTASNNGVGIVFTLYSDCSTFVTPVIEFRDVTFNQWNHVAAMFDVSAQYYTISINGILSSSPLSFTAGTFCSDPTEQFSVGGYYFSDTDTFEGKIDEVRVSDNVRYTTDFTPLNSFIPDTNTKGLWHFDESPGSTSFSDSSGNGNTLTGLNGAQTD